MYGAHELSSKPSPPIHQVEAITWASHAEKLVDGVIASLHEEIHELARRIAVLEVRRDHRCVVWPSFVAPGRLTRMPHLDVLALFPPASLFIVHLRFHHSLI